MTTFNENKLYTTNIKSNNLIDNNYLIIQFITNHRTIEKMFCVKHTFYLFLIFVFLSVLFSVSSNQSKPSSLANTANVGGKAMNSIKKAVAIKNDSEEAKPLVSNSNGR